MDVMTLAAKLTLNTSEFTTDLKDSEKKMKGISTGQIAWGNVISNVFTAAGRALKGFATDTVKVGLTFDETMSQVKALGQLTGDDFVAVRKKAMELGASTKFTATQVGEAFSYMALAGWNTEEMLGGIDGVLNLAAASGEDLGKVSDIVTDALTAFGLGAEDTAHFVDVLAAASANSNTTVGMMGEAFKYLAANAGVLQYSVDDVAIALGLLANNGIKSTQAGTSMRQIINTLIAPTEKAAAAMEKVGLFLFEDGTDKVKPLRQVLGEMREIFQTADFDLAGKSVEEIEANLQEVDEWYDKWSAKVEKGKVDYMGEEITKKELDKMYQAKIQEVTHFNEDFLGALKEIGGLRGISSLLSLMKTTDDDWNQLVNAVDNSTGSAGEMAETMLDNLQGDITIMQSALEGLQIVVSDSFKNQLRDFVQTLTTEIGKMNEAFQQNGALGMFVNLAEWVVNGIADSLKNPDKAQVKSFGEAIGEFVGSVAAMIVTDLPSLLNGMVSIGESLAGGLVEGIFSGLFGGNADVTNLVSGLNKELNSVELNNVKAQGLLSYLEGLAKAGDENVTATDAWKDAVAQLEAIMPGVKEMLEADGATLEENIAKVRRMTDEFRNQAIQQAMVNTLQKEYELLAEKGVEREKEVNKIGTAQNEQKAINEKLTENIYRYAIRAADLINSGDVLDPLGDNQRLIEQIKQGGIYIGDEFRSFADMDAAQLKGVLTDLMSLGSNPFEKDIWETDQNYLSPDEVDNMVTEYDQAAGEIQTATDKISAINGEIDALKGEIATTESAVQNVTAELNASAEGVGSAGGGVVSALSSLSAQLASISFSTGEKDGSHASGLLNVPYDGYIAELHRGERVVTASQARKGMGGTINVDQLATMLEAAIKAGMEGATVNSYISGQKVTDDVNRRQVQQLKARRFAT